MVRVCCVCKRVEKTAKSLKRGEEKITFHHFPKVEELRNAWVKAIPFANFVLKNSTVICSDHFLKTDYLTGRTGKPFLDREAIPVVPRINFNNLQMKSVPESFSSDSQELHTTLDIPLSPDQIKLEEETSVTEGNSDRLIECNESPRIGIVVENLDSVPSDYLPENIVAGPSISGTSTAPSSPESYEFCSPKKVKLDVDPEAAKEMNKILEIYKAKHLKKVTNLPSLIEDLRENRFITVHAKLLIMATLPRVSEETMKKILSGDESITLLKPLAIALNFFSRRAYEYLQDNYLDTLPNPLTATGWTENYSFSQGITKQSTNFLKQKVREARVKGEKCFCNLIFKEIQLEEKVEWNGTKFTGYVDLGLCLDSSELEKARSALVFMVVGLNSLWRVPVAYYFIRNLTVSEQANLLLTLLEHLDKSGINIISITFDGTETQKALFKLLGVNLELDSLNTFFHHPITKHKVFLMPDALTMLKEIENCLISQEILTSDMKVIKWKYLEKLKQLRNMEGLPFGAIMGSQRSKNVKFDQEKVKLKLKFEPFNLCVAQALEFLNLDLVSADFNQSEATSHFIKMINNLFDVFNSKNILAKYEFKKGISRDSTRVFEYLEEIKRYFLGLWFGNGETVLRSKKKKGFVGFFIGIESLKGIFKEYLDKKESRIKTLLTYRFSLEHLQAFFEIVESRTEFSKISPKLFEETYKKLLSSPDLTETTNLNVIYTSKSSLVSDERVSDVPLWRKLPCRNIWHNTIHPNADVTFAANLISLKLKSIINCIFCLQLVYQEPQEKQPKTLNKSTNFLVKICKITDLSIKINKGDSQKKLFSTIMLSTVFDFISLDRLNEHFGDHLMNQDPLDNHAYQLIKLIVENYCELKITDKKSKSFEFSLIKTEKF